MTRLDLIVSTEGIALHYCSGYPELCDSCRPYWHRIGEPAPCEEDQE